MSAVTHEQDQALRSMDRVLAAARGVCAELGCPMDLAHDAAHEIHVRQLAGERIGLDRRTLTWKLKTWLIESWLGRRRPETVRAVAEMMATRPGDPEAAADCQRIYEMASPCQREVIMSLLLHGPYRHGASDRAENGRRGQHLYLLRQKVNS